MSPVEPISALAAANEALSVTTNPSSAQTLKGPSVEELTNRFRAMMESPQAINNAPPALQETALTHMLSNSEDPIRHTQEKSAQLLEQSHFMTSSELAMASIELSRSVSIDAFRMQTASSLASGTNKSLQSLLKNQ